MNDHFRTGFLRAIAENGITPEDLEKKANLGLLGFGLGGAANAVADAGLASLLLGGIGIPAAGGAGLGYLAHKAKSTPVEENVIEDHKTKQMLDEYKYQIAQIKNRHGLK